MDNIESASIRVDAATQQGSVFDVVKMVLGCDSSSANTAFRRLKQDFPEFGAGGCSQLRINGKGKLTPVADAKTLVEIAMLLPGKSSAKFRWEMAGTVCRVVGGDVKLLEEIKENDQKWKSIDGGSLIQQALLKKSEYWEEKQTSPRVSECLVRDALALVVGGEIEVETPAGFIDVLSDTVVIEVKYFKKWKHGLGQVLAYQSFYPRLSKRLHLFAHMGDLDTHECFTLAKSVCDVHAVEVTFEEVNDTSTVKRPRDETKSGVLVEVCKRRAVLPN